MMEEPHLSPRCKTNTRGSVEKANHRHGLLLHENEVCSECSNNRRRIDNLHKEDRHQNIMSSVALKNGVEKPLDNQEGGEVH